MVPLCPYGRFGKRGLAPFDSPLYCNSIGKLLICKKDEREACITIGLASNILTERFSNPDPHDPYAFNGRSYAPETYARIFRTPADVVAHLRQGKITRRMIDEDIHDQNGIDLPAISQLVNEGRGSLATFMAVIGALGITPLKIPISIIHGE